MLFFGFTLKRFFCPLGLMLGLQALIMAQGPLFDYNFTQVPQERLNLSLATSKLTEINLLENETRLSGNLSNKLVLNFAQLKNFSHQIKRCQNGNVLHCLVFAGLAEREAKIGELMQKLAQINVPYADKSAFVRFSVQPKAQKQADGSFLPELCVFLEQDPKQSKILVQQAAGQDMVEIEVFNRHKLKQVAAGHQRGSVLTLAASNCSFAAGAWLKI